MPTTSCAYFALCKRQARLTAPIQEPPALPLKGVVLTWVRRMEVMKVALGRRRLIIYLSDQPSFPALLVPDTQPLGVRKRTVNWIKVWKEGIYSLSFQSIPLIYNPVNSSYPAFYSFWILIQSRECLLKSRIGTCIVCCRRHIFPLSMLIHRDKRWGGGSDSGIRLHSDYFLHTFFHTNAFPHIEKHHTKRNDINLYTIISTGHIF